MFSLNITMTTPWLTLVMRIKKQYPTLSFKEVLKKAKQQYKK